MPEIPTVPNPDLVVLADNKPGWNQPDRRRHGFHNFHTLARYSQSYRAARVMVLEKRMDLRIPALESVRAITTLPWFSGIAVIRGRHVLFERYSPDFGPYQPHGIQSISKMTMNLVIGKLVEEGKIDPARRVQEYIPEIGSGYATASVQQLLNMDVANDYTEDYDDPFTSAYLQEEAVGWRLPSDPAREDTTRAFVSRITGKDTTNRTGKADYKSANTEVLGWIAERVSGRPLRHFLADIADAAGIEGCLHMTTDRDGVPLVDGGICLTARDLARFGALFVRRGRGVDGRQVGSAAFIERTRTAGIPLKPPRDWLRYSNQTNTDGRWLGHGGYGGQYMLADLESGVVAAFFSVLEDKNAYDLGYFPPVIRMLAEIARLEFADDPS
jgi:CubicO group peptidase (beta-lactamase class C family)